MLTKTKNNQDNKFQYYGEKDVKDSINPATAQLLQNELLDLKMNPIENVFVTQSYLGDQRNGKSNFCTWNVVMKVPSTEHDKSDQ